MVGLLAVLKAGAAYLPLDADSPAQRLSYMLDDSRAKLLITSTRLAGLLDAGQPALVLDEAALQAQLAREPARALTDAERVRALSPANLAYLIYTSGSTGKPKAVGVTNAPVINLARAQIERFDIRAQDRVLQFASSAFDASVSEIVTALGSSAALVISSEVSARQLQNLRQVLDRYGITHATLSPSLLNVVSVDDIASLRVLVVAGEACSPALVSRFARGRRMVNAYCPT